MRSNSGKTQPVEQRLGSLPVDYSERTWNPWLAAAVCATAAVATWGFVLGGFTAYYVDARTGTATLIAGALIAQMLVCLAQVPPTTKHGLETVVTTKPQLGVLGSYIALFVHYAILMGWNVVIMIFFGRSMASILQAANLIGEEQRGSVSVLASLVGLALVWILLTRASQALKYVAPIVAITVGVTAVWMFILLFRAYGLDGIMAAEPLAPMEGGRLVNYTIAIEIMLLAILAWWPYMGAVLRLVSSAGKAILPSMIGLGGSVAVIGLIGLYAALVAGETDPTVWMLELGGPLAGVSALIFVAVANIGSTLVGAHAATLGLGQVPVIMRWVKSWKGQTAIALAPAIVVLALFPGPFYDNVGVFLAFIGVLLGPIIGIQIVDWHLLKTRMHLPSLYRHDRRSEYWYSGGFNIVGLIALAVGVVVFLLLLDPVTYVPRSPVYQYTSASLPSVFAGGLTYWIGVKVVGSAFVKSGNDLGASPKKG